MAYVPSQKARDSAQQKVARTAPGRAALRARSAQKRRRGVGAAAVQNRMPLWLGAGLIVIAIVIDLADLLSGLILGGLGSLILAGPMLAGFLSIAFNMIFGPMFLMIFVLRLGVVETFQARRVVIWAGAFLLEFMPLLNILPGWTLAVAVTVYLARREDKKRKARLKREAQMPRRLRRPRGGFAPAPA